MTQRGFTLIELLVALAIFAILSTLAYGGLTQVIDNREHLEAQAERLIRLQTAFTFISRDIEQAVQRPVRDGYGDTQPALLGNEIGSVVFEVTRSGLRNPLGLPRASLQRVAYRLEEEKLMRLHWPVLDQAQDTQAVERTLLEDVQSMSLRYLDKNNQWHDEWQPQSATPPDYLALPRLVEVSLEVKGFGEIKRLFGIAAKDKS